MTARSFAYTLIAGLIAGIGASQAQAQMAPLEGIYEGHDLQLFKPVGLDFDCNPIRPDCGFFFGYEKINWAFTGERTRIGSENAQAASQNPFRLFEDGSVFGFDIDGNIVYVPGTLVAINPPLRASTINNAPPFAPFAWGTRYELGFFEKGDGWMVGILDGPEAISQENFGLGVTVPDGYNGLASPLGSVYVAFDVPVLYDGGTPNDPSDDITLMHGYLDVLSAIGGSLVGDTNGDGVLDGDGFADDINGNAIYGPDGIDTEDPGRQPDTIVVPSSPDLGDLVLLPTAWQTLNVRNQTKTNGIEIMKTYRLPNRFRMAKRQNNDLEIGYGFRYFRLDDRFDVSGEGGTLGSSFWDTRIDHHIVGPQIALKWLRQKGKFLWDINGRFLFGYSVQNWEQSIGLGENLIPGAHNSPLYFDPTYATYGKQEQDFSPLAEMRVQLSYQLTAGLAVKLGYNALFVDNVRRAAQQVRYSLPDMGFIDGGTSEIFINGVNMGFEAVY